MWTQSMSQAVAVATAWTASRSKASERSCLAVPVTAAARSS